MVSSASREKVTAVLSETRGLEQTELMTSLSAKELSLLETEIVKRLGNKPSDRLRGLLATVRQITLFKAARDVFCERSDQIHRKVKKAMRRRLIANSRRDEGYG